MSKSFSTLFDNTIRADKIITYRFGDSVSRDSSSEKTPFLTPFSGPEWGDTTGEPCELQSVPWGQKHSGHYPRFEAPKALKSHSARPPGFEPPQRPDGQKIIGRRLETGPRRALWDWQLLKARALQWGFGCEISKFGFECLAEGCCPSDGDLLFFPRKRFRKFTAKNPPHNSPGGINYCKIPLMISAETCSWQLASS